MRKILSFVAVFVFVLSGCTNEDDSNLIVNPETDITYSKGNANAKVVITEYSDYECQFCADFALQILPQLHKDYIENGKVRFVFKDFLIQNHRLAQQSSESTYCAGEQDENMFWQMHVDLLSFQERIGRENLTDFAKKYDLNVEAFDACVDSGRYKNLVLRNRKEGRERGVNATPTFFVNETKMVGVQPYENIKKIIDAELIRIEEESAN